MSYLLGVPFSKREAAFDAGLAATAAETGWDPNMSPGADSLRDPPGFRWSMNARLLGRGWNLAPEENTSTPGVAERVISPGTVGSPSPEDLSSSKSADGVMDRPKAMGLDTPSAPAWVYGREPRVRVGVEFRDMDLNCWC